MKPKMGRPKLPKSEVREILLQVRVNKDEDRQIRAAIAKSPHNKAEWLRNALLSAARGNKSVS